MAALATAVILAAGLLLPGCSDTGADPERSRADLLPLESMQALGRTERPVVLFPHDLHTAALSRAGQDCRTCHPVEADQKLSPRYQRLADADRLGALEGGYADRLMELYHDSCTACHQRMSDAGQTSGPLTCGDCHRKRPRYKSDRQPMAMDKSLHYRHVVANEQDCFLCHHKAATREEIVSCRDCHLDRATEQASSIREAAHEMCVNCHVTKQMGALTCAGCHDARRQAAWVKLRDIPRLQIGQPDFTILNAAPEELAQAQMGTVPFSHVGHEDFTDNCRVCHHVSMKSCAQCHRLQKDETTGAVKLAQAMHDIASPHSCVGCHEQAKGNTDCAGCHGLMEQGRLSQHACNICHAGPAPQRLEAVRGRYTSLDDFRPSASETRLSYDERDIPATVTIGILEEQYEPVVFAHRTHIDKLMQSIADNRVATRFHGHEDVVCAGCHHHSPVGKRPPMCESCHGEPFDPADMRLPGLYGAYHRQCMGCHDRMGLENAGGQDCESCHAAKGM